MLELSQFVKLSRYTVYRIAKLTRNLPIGGLQREELVYFESLWINSRFSRDSLNLDFLIFPEIANFLLYVTMIFGIKRKHLNKNSKDSTRLYEIQASLRTPQN